MAAMKTKQSYAIATLVLSIISACAEGLLLNIHLPLKLNSGTHSQQCLENVALACNLALRQAACSNDSGAVSEEIDFFSKHSPHITLYLVDFNVEDENGTVVESKLDTIYDALQHALQNTTKTCRVDWPPIPTIREGYAMFFVNDESQCLRHLSDIVVNATMQYIHRPPVIPDWIHSLPEPERKRAFERIHTFGSPNVRDGFQPHITVGYDAITPKRDRLATLNSLFTPQPCDDYLTDLAVAKTGISGTVLQNGELFRISLVNDTDKALNSRGQNDEMEQE